MNDLLGGNGLPRRVMTLFFIVDTSGSMAGSKIAAVNTAVREILPMLDDISRSNADAEIKLAVLEFNSAIKWMYDSPKKATEFLWIDLQANGLTHLGEACSSLAEKLSRKEFMSEVTGAFAPVLILLSDGEPTDSWQSGLRKLKENRWYQAAIKVAIAIGNDARKDVLKEFTCSEEAVIETHNIESLKAIIRTVSVTASMIGSQSTNVGNKTKQDLVEEQIAQTVQETPGAASAAQPKPIMDDEWD